MPKRVSLKGKGADLFFGDYPGDADADVMPAADRGDGAPGETGTAPSPVSSGTSMAAPAVDGESASPAARREASPRPRRPERKPRAERAAAVPSVDADTVATIRQVIKVPGREVSYLRLTPEEKAHLSDIVYTYKRQGQKTSETEINRIALNYLLLDYHEHGQHSVLARVLAALLA